MKLGSAALAVLTTIVLVSSTSFASGNDHGGGGGSSGSGGGGNDKPLCTGQEPPRQGAPFTELASYGEKIDAYRAALAQYELEHHEAAEYAAVSAEIVGTTCFADDDCSTGDNSKYVGTCLRYVWDGTNGSCQVYPVTPIPQPPAAPQMTCDDVSCPSSFQCEVEDSTGAVGCVEQRTCRVN